MKIGKWQVDYDGEQYWVYSKTSKDKRTGKDSPRDTSYFNTLAGALRCVRHELIGSKIGKNKEDDLATVMAQIINIDKFFTDCLVKLSDTQEKLVSNVDNSHKER